MVNFNEEDGVTITFIPSTQFLWETKLGNSNILTKFVAFIVIRDSIESKSKRIFKKKFERKGDAVYLEEILYDGAGKELEVVTKYQKCDIPFIPAVIITNDGLTGDEDGESEIRLIQDYESWFSKLANADIDAERKSMNPIRYVVDMNPNSTKSLSTSPGALWDLGSDQNTDKQKTMVGMLEPNMSYSVPLKTTLDRIKTVGYEQIDVPNITLETMVGSITSGKALKAIYWPLIVRCKEKMKVWGPALQNIVNIIIQGAYTFPNTVKKYISDPLVPVAYEVKVVQNIPLTMSRKAYMQKWRGLTDDEVQEELEQMALEKQYIDEVAMPMPNQQDQQEGFNEPIEDEPVDDIDTEDAEQARDSICIEDQRKIRDLYAEWADKVAERAAFYEKKITASSYWQQQQMLELERQLRSQSMQIHKEIESGSKSSMYMISDSVVGCNAEFLKTLGFKEEGINAAFTSIPNRVVSNIVTGQIYKSGWSLSKAIWTDNQKTLSDIYSIVAQGRAMNMSAYEVSKMLERYVSPSRKMQWNLKMRDGAKIYKKTVDYNAQRLVRTLNQHAYQQSVIQVAKDNPFIQGIYWRANGSRVCPLCMDRDGNF